MRGVVRGFSYEVGRGVCDFCGDVGSVLTPDTVGESGCARICEHCSLAAGAAWRRFVGEIPPGLPDGDVGQVSLVAVVVARRVKVPDSPGGEPSALESRMQQTAYEFLMVAAPGESPETYALPSAPVLPRASVRDAAGRALDSVGLCSWPALLETLHVGYTPRGRLAAFVLARGYSTKDFTCAVPGKWLPWPASAHAGKLAGLYEFLETTWPLRLYRLCVPGDRIPAEVSVSMREVARRYVDLQSAAGAGVAADTSMLAAYRSAMTADELALAEMVRKFEEGEREGERKSRRQLPPVPPGEGAGTVADRGVGGDSEGDRGDAGDGDPGDEYSENYSEGASGGGDPPPEPGFARRFRGQ